LQDVSSLNNLFDYPSTQLRAPFQRSGFRASLIKEHIRKIDYFSWSSQNVSSTFSA